MSRDFIFNLSTGGSGNTGTGGILNQGTLTITGSHFTDHIGFYGGAIANKVGGTALVTGSSFDNNQGWMGGAITNYGGEMTVDDCTFSGNRQDLGYYGGGAILNYLGDLTVTDSTFSNNSSGAVDADYVGMGGAIATLGDLTVSGSTFDGNTTWGYGGAIASMIWMSGSDPLPDSSTISLTNNTFRGNNAYTLYTIPSDGGAVSMYPGPIPYSLTLTNNTFAANTADNGDNLSFKQDTHSESLAVNAYNNILQGATTGGNCSTVGTISLTASHNLADDATCGAGFTNSASINLGALGDYGGSTKTAPLLPNSSAIDAGDDAHCSAADQRGEPRDDLRCDVGAFELRYADSHAVVRPVSSTDVTTFGPVLAGIERDDGFTDPDVITATKEVWSTHGPESIAVIWGITPTVTSGLSLTLQLC